MYDAIIFDYGNTLIRFDHQEIAALDATLASTLSAMYGGVDIARVKAIRHRNRLAPYAGDPPAYRENDMEDITISLVRELYDRHPTCEELRHLLRVRFESFVAVAKVTDDARHVLQTLSQRGVTLGLLSNYPSAPAIRESLKKNRVADLFHAIVVSDDLGLVKPHAAPFEKVLDELQLKPEHALYVGDNWLADIQGAKRVGMAAALTTQWGGAPEGFAPEPGDLEPDHTVAAIEELLELV